MRHLSIHLVTVLEIVAALVAVPAIGVYGWRGVQRRRRPARRKCRDVTVAMIP